MIEGAPQGTAEQAATAERLGYGAAVGAMVSDHDPLHAALAEWLGLRCSESLALAAGDPGAEPHLAALEEAAVCAVQAYCRAIGLTARDLLESMK